MEEVQVKARLVYFMEDVRFVLLLDGVDFSLASKAYSFFSSFWIFPLLFRVGGLLVVVFSRLGELVVVFFFSVWRVQSSFPVDYGRFPQ